MSLFRSLSKILAALAGIIAVYDLVYFWFLRNKVHIRSVRELWTDLHKDSYESALPVLETVFSSWDKMAGWPAPVLLLVVSAVLYVIFRILFALRGGRGGRFKYKSPD